MKGGRIWCGRCLRERLIENCEKVSEREFGCWSDLFVAVVMCCDSYGRSSRGMQSLQFPLGRARSTMWTWCQRYWWYFYGVGQK